MAEVKLGKVVSTFIAAFIMGVILSVGLTIGVKPTQTGLTLLILKVVCSTGECIDEYNCTNLIWVMTVVSILGLAVSVFTHVKEAGSWRVGLITYAVGWSLGFITWLLVIY